MGSQQRLQYIDALKGLSILCICLIHFEDGIFPMWLNNWIAGFMISAFYITSGWVYGLKPQSWNHKKIFKKRLRQLGIPYLSFSIIFLIIDVIFIILGHYNISILGRDLFKTIVLRGIGTLWFLPALAFGETVFCYIMSKRRKLFIFIVFFIISILFTYFYSEIWTPHFRNINYSYQILDGFIAPFNSVCKAWPIIIIGYFFSINFNKYFIYKPSAYYRLAMLAGGLFTIALSIIYITKLPYNLYYISYIICTLLPSIGFIMLFYALEGSWIVSFFTYWGVNSLILMCTHYSITQEICIYVNKLMTGQDHLSGWPAIAYFVFCIIITYPMVWFINKKCPYIIGKDIKRKWNLKI